METDGVVNIAGEDPLDISDYFDEAALESERCGICLDIVIDRGILDSCDHWFCFTCIDNWAAITNLCPICKGEFQCITCLPVYDSLGNFMVDNELCPREEDDDDEWTIQEKNNALSFPSYYISEDAVKCLDGDGCKIRSGLLVSVTEEDLILDTSIACDSCDVWYHALCVGFDPQDQYGNSWLCPRCIVDAMPKKLVQKTAKVDHSAESNFDTKVSISVADVGETAVIVSMIEEQPSNEVMKQFECTNQSEPIHKNSHESSILDYGADIDNVNIPENDISGSQFLYNRNTPIDESKPSNLSMDMLDKSEVLLDISSKSVPDFMVPEGSLVFSSSEAMSDQVPIGNASCIADDKLLTTSPVQTGKSITPDISAAISSTDEIIDCDYNNNGGDHGTMDPESEVVAKSNTSSSRKDQSLKRLRISDCKIDRENYLKRAKLDMSSHTRQHMNTCPNGSRRHVKKEAVREDGSLPSTSGKDGVTHNIMSIVKDDVKIPLNRMVTKNSVDRTVRGDATKSTGSESTSGDGGSGLRLKKIMHRAGEASESTDLLQQIRKQIRDAICGSSEHFSNNDAFDDKLLAAFRAAITRPKVQVANKVDPVLNGKPILQRGKVRENLTKKIYRTNGRLRRAWDRDCKIEFWKRHCLNNRPKKVEALLSVLDILNGHTSSPGSSHNKQELLGNANNSLLCRVYLADASVLPRKEDIISLSDIAGSSNISANDQRMGYNSTTAAKDSLLVCREKSVRETMSISEQVTKVPYANGEATSSMPKVKKAYDKGPKSGTQLSSLESNCSKDSSLPSAKDDKRRWALEVLARKTAVSVSPKEQEKQEDNILAKGSFPLLAQLPMDMRPLLEPNRSNKVPLSTRQAQLYRLAEFYLKRANLPVIRRTAATELAIADAMNIEKEIFERSKSKMIYINLCSQHMVNFQPQTAEKVYTEMSSVFHENVEPTTEQANEHFCIDSSVACEIEEALKIAGLLSDSPPCSPTKATGECDSKDCLARDTGNGDIGNALEINCNTELNVGDTVIENSLHDPCKLPSVEPDSEMALPTTSSEKLINIPEMISACEDQPMIHSSVGFAESELDSSSKPLCEHQGPVVTPEFNMVSYVSSSAQDLPEKEKYDESSLAQCEDLSGSADGFCGEEKMIAQKPIPCEEGSDKLKNLTSTLDSEGIRKIVKEIGAEKALPSVSLCEDVVSVEDCATLDSSKDSISQKVEAYIKEHIRPLCKSGIITVEQYRWAVGKTRDKVLKYHSKAKNANFLIREGDKVKKLAQQYAEAASKQDLIRK